MKRRKDLSKIMLQKSILDVSNSLTASVLINMLSEASADGGGGKMTPRLYDLIELYRSNQGVDELRGKLVEIVTTIVSSTLQTFDLGVAFQFRKLLRDTELIDGSESVRKAIKAYVDQRITVGDVNALNFAIGILRTGRAPAKAAAEAWLPLLRGFMQQAPSWLVLDVLIEMKGLVSEGQYSEGKLLEDVQRLRGRPEYESEIERRRVQLLKQWQISSQELEDINPKSPNLRNTGRTFDGVHSGEEEINELAQVVQQQLSNNVVPLRKIAGSRK